MDSDVKSSVCMTISVYMFMCKYLDRRLYILSATQEIRFIAKVFIVDFFIARIHQSVCPNCGVPPSYRDRR